MQCLECLGPIEGEGRKDRKFCTKACSQENQRKKWRAANPKTANAMVATGAIAELNQQRVIADLVHKQYMVYRALYQGMPYSLIATTEGAIVRVETVTGTYTTSGNLSYPKRDTSKFDVLAVVTAKAIHYIPEILL